jgi:hypothetical protein
MLTRWLANRRRDHCEAGARALDHARSFTCLDRILQRAAQAANIHTIG